MFLERRKEGSCHLAKIEGWIVERGGAIKCGRLIEGQKRPYLTSTDRVSEVGTSSSNFGTFSGTMPSLVSMISSRRLVSVSLRDRSSIVRWKRG